MSGWREQLSVLERKGDRLTKGRIAVLREMYFSGTPESRKALDEMANALWKHGFSEGWDSGFDTAAGDY